MVGGVWAACDAGDTSANNYTYGDATDITHGDYNARSHVHCDTHTSADRNRRAAHSDAGRNVHGDT